jgi:antagonist of KipI
VSLRVLRPGLLTTLQDRGRYGMQHLGIVPCGAMDEVAHRLANAMVGNVEDEATLEITVLGPELVFDEAVLVAICGAEFEVKSDGRPFPLNRPVFLEAGSRLVTGRALRGSRAYLAAAGGIQVEPVLESRSTYLPAAFGGHKGRILIRGDTLPLSPEASSLARQRYAKLAKSATERFGMKTVRWSSPALTTPEHEPIVVHAMEGRHFSLFEPASQRAFFEATWRVSPDSNRMGYRLTGPKLVRVKTAEILSGPTCLGTVQVPASGAPIALMADHQTTGGYPKIAEIAFADVPRMAQLAPGGALRFARCTLDEAHELRRVTKVRVDASLRSIAWAFGR